MAEEGRVPRERKSVERKSTNDELEIKSNPGNTRRDAQGPEPGIQSLIKST